MRFDQARAGADYALTKELHLSRLHNPHGDDLHEQYCRRWVSLRLIAEARAAPPAGLVTLLDARRSRYLGTDDEYLCLTLARAGAPEVPAMSVTVGLRDDNLRQQFKFLADPALPARIVNETCERCPLPDCQERAALPVQVQRAAEQAAYEAAVAELVGGE